MNSAGLADLDELVLLCLNKRSYPYISEAVSCYKVGAFRACIVTTWIAVCFDIIEKLSDLSLAGDKAADTILRNIENARSRNDITRALKLEKDLLGHAKDDFELLSPIEHADLERLHEDRNRCAHPSLISVEQPFTPSAELARVHIRSAVTHLIQHPPVQGKYALERLKADVRSEYFPTDKGKASTSLASGPLKRPRDSLVRSFSIWLLKIVLADTCEHSLRRRSYAALLATRSMNVKVFETLLSEKLTPLFRATDDEDIHLSISLLEELEDCWQYLDDDVKRRLEVYVYCLPANRIEDLNFLLSFAPLSSQAKSRLQRASSKELGAALFFRLHPLIADKIIDIYIYSRSYSEANAWSETFAIAIYVDCFTASQQVRMLRGMAANGEILGSFQVENVIESLRHSKRIDALEFDKVLLEVGLEQYVSDSEAEGQK